MSSDISALLEIKKRLSAMEEELAAIKAGLAVPIRRYSTLRQASQEVPGGSRDGSFSKLRENSTN